MQEATNEINKMKRQLFLTSAWDIRRKLNVPHRRVVAEGYPKLAVPSRSVKKSQHRTDRLPRWNGCVVYPGPDLRGMEGDRFPVVDPW